MWSGTTTSGPGPIKMKTCCPRMAIVWRACPKAHQRCTSLCPSGHTWHTRCQEMQLAQPQILLVSHSSLGLPLVPEMPARISYPSQSLWRLRINVPQLPLAVLALLTLNNIRGLPTKPIPDAPWSRSGWKEPHGLRNILHLPTGLINVRSAVKHCAEIHSWLESKTRSLLGITETWFSESHVEILPQGCSMLTKNRIGKGGGRLVMTQLSTLNCSIVPTEECKGFLAICVSPTSCSSVVLVQLYHPPGPLDDFEPTFSDILIHLKQKASQICVLGDFNLHLETGPDGWTMQQTGNSAT